MTELADSVTLQCPLPKGRQRISAISVFSRASAEEGPLSAAGRALGMTQPTVGRQVAALEKELDVILFDRVGKQRVLNPQQSPRSLK